MKTQKAKRLNKLEVNGENQCIWMKAGVVNFKLCDNAYDCLTCPFDKAMSRAVKKESAKIISWREAMREQPYAKRECRHMLTGRVEHRYCSNAYRCDVCEFDQALDESDLNAAPTASSTRNVSGFKMADGYHYHRGHSWARVEHGGFVRIGIDDFTLKLLGAPNEVRLPRLGSPVEQTEVGWSIEREHKTAEMLAPLNGVVVATNHKVLRHPEMSKNDPYGKGWLLVVEPKNLKQNLKNLLFEREASVWLGDEARRLENIMMESYGMSMAATGGEIVDDIYGNLPDMKWERLVHEFLLT